MIIHHELHVSSHFSKAARLACASATRVTSYPPGADIIREECELSGGLTFSLILFNSTDNDSRPYLISRLYYGEELLREFDVVSYLQTSVSFTFNSIEYVITIHWS